MRFQEYRVRGHSDIMLKQWCNCFPFCTVSCLSAYLHWVEFRSLISKCRRYMQSEDVRHLQVRIIEIVLRALQQRFLPILLRFQIWRKVSLFDSHPDKSMRQRQRELSGSTAMLLYFNTAVRHPTPNSLPSGSGCVDWQDCHNHRL